MTLATQAKTLPWARRVDNMMGSIIDSSTSILASQQHDIVRFAMGAPNEDLIPVATFDQIAGEYFEGKYDYGSSEGEAHLMDQIMALPQVAKESVGRKNLTITTGGMQGLDLVFKMFLDPGDLIIVEGPTYTNANGTALSYGADILQAPIDENGLIVEKLAELVARTGKTPKIVYTIPNFQNPSGATLSLERRRMLLDLVQEWGCILLDDDPYGMLRFEGEDLPSLSELSPGNPQIIAVRTFSKILAPGIRVGWVQAHEELQEKFIMAKQAMDTCTHMPGQALVSRFLAGGHLDEHLGRILPMYKERKNVMIEALAEHFGDDVQATNPQGGFFLWVQLKGRLAKLNTEKTFESAVAGGVAFIPGPAFSVQGDFQDALRLCFATSTPERIHTGVERLARVLYSLSEES